MTDKHTPGPWTTTPCSQIHPIPCRTSRIVGPANSDSLFEDVDARLIAAAPELLKALEALREDLQTRLDASTEGMTVADGLVDGEDANRSWRSWLFDVMSTHGDITRAAIKAAKEDA